MSLQSDEESLFVPRPSAAGDKVQGPDNSRPPAPCDKKVTACTTIFSTPDPSPPSSPKARPEGAELLAGLGHNNTTGSEGIGIVPGVNEISRDRINNIVASKMEGSSLSNLSDYEMLDEFSSKESIGVEDLPSGTNHSDDEMSDVEDITGLVPNSENMVSRNQVGNDFASTLAMISSMDTLPSMTDGHEGYSCTRADTDLSLALVKISADVVPSGKDDGRNLRALDVDAELDIADIRPLGLECPTKRNNEELPRNDNPGKTCFFNALTKAKGGMRGPIRLLITSVGVSVGRLLNGCAKPGRVLSCDTSNKTASAAENGSGTDATIRNDSSGLRIGSHVVNATSVVKTKRSVSGLNAIWIRNAMASIIVSIFLWHAFTSKNIIVEEQSTLDHLVCVSGEHTSFMTVSLWEMNLSSTLSKLHKKVSLEEHLHDDHRCFTTHTSSFDSIPLWEIDLTSSSFDQSSTGELLRFKQPLDRAVPTNFRMISFVILTAISFSVALIFKQTFWEHSTLLEEGKDDHKCLPSTQLGREAVTPEPTSPAHAVTEGMVLKPIFPTTQPHLGSSKAAVLRSDSAKKQNKELLNGGENNLEERAETALANECTSKNDLELEKISEKLETLQSENRDLREENDDLKQELNQIIPQKVLTSEQIAKLVEEKNALTKETNRRIAQLMQKVHGLMEEKESLTGENSNLMENNDRLKERAESAEMKLASLEQQLALLEAQYTSLEQNMTGLEAHSASLIEDIIRSV